MLNPLTPSEDHHTAPPETVELFRSLGTPRGMARHAVVYSPGQPAFYLYLIVSGEVKIFRTTPDGRELGLAHLRAGAVFGEQELLISGPRASHAVARTELTALSLERAAVLEQVRKCPAFALWLTRLMAQRQARLEERLESLLFTSANGKVAQVLLGLARSYGRLTQEGTLIDYPITHQEIGNLIATTRETVSYAFMEFRQRGLICTRQRRTIVRNMQALGQLALA